jgi:hypothetical protein
VPISTEPSTFEFTRDWLVSSETFIRDAMGSTAVDLDTARDEARARIYEEEALDESNEPAEGETTPDAPPSVASRPRAIVITESNEAKIVGTATSAESGSLLIDIEIPVPDEFKLDFADDTPEDRATAFKARKLWERQLWSTIRRELLATRGQGDEQGNPYLNAMNINGRPPADPEPGEGTDWIGWTFEVPWKG